jgi:hypothetical protein
LRRSSTDDGRFREAVGIENWPHGSSIANLIFTEGCRRREPCRAGTDDDAVEDILGGATAHSGPLNDPRGGRPGMCSHASNLPEDSSPNKNARLLNY